MPFNNTNSGVLFKADEPKDNPNWPDYKGQIETKCQHCGCNTSFWLSAWLKISGSKSKNPGTRYQSLAATEKDDTNHVPEEPRSTSGKGFDDPKKDIPKDDEFDIPF